MGFDISIKEGIEIVAERIIWLYYSFHEISCVTGLSIERIDKLQFLARNKNTFK